MYMVIYITILKLAKTTINKTTNKIITNTPNSTKIGDKITRNGYSFTQEYKPPA